MIVALALVLAAAPASSCAPPLDDDARARAGAIALALRDAEAHATEDPEDGVAGLEAALARADADGEVVARDPAAADARLYAQLALARSLLATDRRAEAVTVIDAALATAGGRELPTKLFGPSLVSLHDERVAALAKLPKGTLELRCKASCFVAVEATPVACGDAFAATTVELPPGSYRVVLLDAADASRRVREQIEIVASATATVVLDNAPVVGPGPRRGRGRTLVPDTVDSRRKLPRWAGIVGMAVGAGTLIAGGVLLGVDGRCTDLSDPGGPNPCADVLVTDVAGYVTMGIGAGVLLGFTAAFGVGEARQAKARRRNIAWRPFAPPPSFELSR